MIAKIADIPRQSPPTKLPSESRRRGTLHTILAPLASLRLTVVLLALTTLLVYLGTSVQKDIGNWDAQRHYFHSWYSWIDLRLFTPLWDWGFNHIPGRIIMPGGYTLILLLLANLIAAHAVRFKINRKRMGVLIIHGGLIVLILGEVITSLASVETRMTIEQGQTVQYAADLRHAELAIVDPSPADHDNVVAIPESKLTPGRKIVYPTLPFSVRVEKFFRNSSVITPEEARKLDPPRPIFDAAANATIVQEPASNGLENAIDTPSALITLATSDSDQELRTIALSTLATRPQAIDINGKRYELSLRFKRDYKPYSLELIKFSFDRYTGTNLSRNYSSVVRLRDPRFNEDRVVRIWMNHPLRHAGETIYQADFNNRTEAGTILMVVRNPGWVLPYVSCTIIALGLVIHFGSMLLAFLRRTRAGAVQTTLLGERFVLQPRSGGVLWPALITLACAVFLLSMGRPPRFEANLNLNTFGRIPINFDGRVMPMDSLARISLRVISGKSDLRASDGKRIPAIEWLADVFAKPQLAAKYEVFRIDHPDVINLLELDAQRKMFSFAAIRPNLRRIDEQVARIQNVPKNSLDTFQLKLRDLHKHLQLFLRLADGSGLYIAPPQSSGEDWTTLADAAQRADSGNINPGYATYRAMLYAYSSGDTELFDSAGDGYLAWLRSKMPAVAHKIDLEVLLNYFDPFINSAALYVLAFLLACAAFLFPSAQLTFRRSAFCVLVLTLAYHTLGLIARIYIQGRPPVTNLYSSAIFIGWAAVVFCTVTELIYRNGLAIVASCAIAFPTLIIAHYLAPIDGNGDTMAMLQAVLDTNIWLATHVVVVTLGYTATFLAGIIACAFVIGRWLVARANLDAFSKTMTRIIYGVLCFALLFSFVGTVLGGIWADQSWGRFWGWDPKENGAVMIVLWNAIILHARWAGLIKAKGLANLAIVGNIVTAWSWFGTNLLGVGFHSYGFMDSGVRWLGIFAASQLLILGIGLLPSRDDLSAPLAASQIN